MNTRTDLSQTANELIDMAQLADNVDAELVAIQYLKIAEAVELIMGLDECAEAVVALNGAKFLMEALKGYRARFFQLMEAKAHISA